MPYIGTSAATNFATTIKDSFTGDGSTTSYTLSRNAVNAFDLEVFIGNVRQEPESAYTVSGATLAFTGTPANGEVIYVVHQAGALQTVKAPVDHGARDFQFSGDGQKISFGSDLDVTLTHTHNAGLTLKNANTTDDSPFTLTLQTGETDIAINDKLGVINFQAPDEAAGTDAILVAAGIEAVSEGDFSASNNSTKLSFLTGSSGAATEKMSLSSAGNLDVTGNMTIGGNLDVTGTVSFSENNVTDVGIMSLDTLRGDADTDTSLVFSGSNVITIATGGTTAMTIDASQNTTLAGTLTAVTSIGIGSAVLTEAEMEKLDGITNGAGAANKAVVLDGDADIASGLRNITASGTINSAAITSTSTIQGTTITATTAFVPDASDGAALGTTALEFSDLFLADGAVINFGADQDITLTHTADTGLATNGTFSATAITGTTITASTSFLPDAQDGAALGTTSLQFSDLFLADGAVVGLGDDNDTTLTHVADTGVLLNSSRQLQFGDSGTFISQSADGILDLQSDNIIELTATTIDINGAVALNGAITGATNITLTGELDAATGDFSGVVDVAGATTVVALTASGLVTAGAKIDMNGTELILDADADTSITADTDDQIDIRIAGADDFTFTANTFTAVAGSTIAAQALTATTITASGVVDITDATDASDATGDTGALRTEGGASIAKKLYVGTDLDVGGTTTAVALTASGLVTANADMLIGGVTPTLTIGDAGAEDTKIVFDGNAQDFHIGLDDSADDLVIGLGSALGTTPAISIDENVLVTIADDVSVVGRAFSPTLTTNLGSAINLALGNNFLITTTGDVVLTFTNQIAGQSGTMKFVNDSNRAVTAHTNVAISEADLATISATGTYMVSYFVTAAAAANTILVSASAILT
jgi:hypothetical protein